ncbi:MAG: methylenetetrahydrofolate reductase [NAD(P)H] [Ruminococcus sp.]|nr:methylenetetrahydrofolate reductase [NAD(P)H] [Ruminococcus sp.]MBQ8905689.1 methylenetetrahydrofolate reductase [NAD(P)H] [Ruminococcus sp.]
MENTEIFRAGKCAISFEVFPPKPTTPPESVYQAIEAISKRNPAFISVTAGAGGSKNAEKTLEIAKAIQDDYGVPSMAHMPCINLTKEDVLTLLEEFKQAGIRNILALRGDRTPGVIPKTDFQYASDLISFIREHGDFNIIGACYPEGHSESQGLIEDIWNLKKKVDAGTNGLITQLFLSNRYFYAFRERVAMTGIDVPISAGIMPVTSLGQIKRMCELSNAKLPKQLVAILTKYEKDPVSLRAAGIEYAVNQIRDLILHGVDGIHIYTMNNPETADLICNEILDLIPYL